MKISLIGIKNEEPEGITHFRMNGFAGRLFSTQAQKKSEIAYYQGCCGQKTASYNCAIGVSIYPNKGGILLTRANFVTRLLVKHGRWKNILELFR